MLFHSRATMSQNHLRVKRSADQKDSVVATPEEFVRLFGGNRVINRVNIIRQITN